MRDHENPIPKGPWMRGDLPKEGRAHVVIYTGGRKYGPVMLDDPPTEERRFDAVCEFDRGDLELADPGAKDREIYGLKASFIHDGYCGIIKMKCALMDDQDQLRRTLEASCQAGITTVAAAKSRPKVKMLGEADAEVMIHVGFMSLRCHSGRHRATIEAVQAAIFLRAAGCTVQIVHWNLYSGVVPKFGHKAGQVDRRGPCGCHLHPGLCQFVQKMGVVQKRRWIDVNDRADREADEHFSLLLLPFRARLRGGSPFSGRTHCDC
jgi:hypothetical protein